MAAVGVRVARRAAVVSVVVLIGSVMSLVDRPQPAEAAPVPCVPEQADAAAAGRMAGVCGRRVEVLAERTEFAQVFVNVDGSRTLEQTIEPARVRQGKSWVPVDTSLRATADGVVPRATVLPMEFSVGGNTLVGRLRDGARELAVNWPRTLPRPVLKGSTAVYQGVLPGVNLEVTAHATGFSEVLVVRDRKAAANPQLASLRFGIAAKGVTVVAAPGGGLVARDGKGEPVFRAPAPLMWDSAPSAGEAPSNGPNQPADKRPTGADRARAAPQEPAVGEAAAGRRAPEHARQAVMPVKVGGEAITITPDKAMLSDPRTRYPVYIDPMVTGGLVNNEWTSVWSKHPSSSFWKNTTALTNGSTYGSAGAGRTEDCVGCADHIIRSLFRMNTSKVKKTQIIAAQFRIEQRHAWTCSPASNAKLWLTGGFSASTTWQNQPTWNSGYTAQTSGNRKYGAVHGCLGTGTIEFNVKSMVALSAANGWNITSLGLRAVDESTLRQWKRFNPSTARLSITYNMPPSAPSALKSDGKTCAVGAARPYVLWTTPTMAAKQSDPDAGQQNLTTDFYWWPKGGARSEANKVSQSNGNNTIVSKAIPAGRLADGGTYVWQARTSDGNLSTWSGTCEFTVDATPPPVPGAVTSTDYVSGTPLGGVGLAGTFRIAPPSVRPHEVSAYAWTLDSGVLITSQTVPVSPTDRSGTLSVKPAHDGVNTLRVWSKDHAGRFSTVPVTYTFSVRAGAGPAAEWNFDETADISSPVPDVSRHGNTVSILNASALARGRGQLGKALSMNGNTGYASTSGPVTYPHPDTGASTAVRTDAGFTVAARVLHSGDSTRQRVVLAASGSRSSAYTLAYGGSSGRWSFAMAGADTDNPTSYEVVSNAPRTAGKWTHLAATFNASTKKLTLYVDGVAQTATATLVGGFNATGSTSIGKRWWNGASEGHFNGVVDDVRIYSFVESAAKIAELAVPLPPVLTLPDGDTAVAGGKLPVLIDAGGDVNVTKFRYSLGGTSLATQVDASVAGGAATVTLDVGTVTGQRVLHVVAVDTGNRVSGLAHIEITVLPGAGLSGRVADIGTSLPIVGATVRLQPGGRQVTTDADGTYAFTNLANGTYTVAANHGGRCGMAGSQPFEIDGQGLALEVHVSRIADNLGHSCAEKTAAFPTATTLLPLAGDDAVSSIDLPFVFPFYGGAHRTAWIDTNGFLSFADPLGSHPHRSGTPLVTAAEPNAVVAPFWDDLVVDAHASVRTGLLGTGADRQLVVEWRNAHRKGDAAQRLSFAVTLRPDGTVTAYYDGLDNAAEQGSSALVGIESPDGEDGLAYSTDDAALANGRAIAFTRPDVAGGFETHDLTGTLADSDGAPVAGATVRVDPGGLTTTTAANGGYTFRGLVADSYTITSKQAGRCAATAESQVELLTDTVRNLRFGADFGAMGYACAVGPANYVTATTVLPLTGDDVETDVALPFAMQFYGRSSAIATVSTNGWIGIGGGYLQVFSADLVVDGASGVRTQAVGSAPNRSFVVEWRDVQFVGTAERVTFEVVLHEDGRVTYQYGALTTDLQRGGNATVGLKALAGQVANDFASSEPVLTAHSAITYTPASTGIIRGVLTEAVSTGPIAGTTIRLNPSGRSVTTSSDGSFEFAGVPVGAYQLLASSGDERCLGQFATAAVHKTHGDASADLSLNTGGDQYHECTTTAQPFVPGDTVQDWAGDDEMWRAVAPFPIRLYGESTTTPWVSSNGFITFGPDNGTDSIATPIPSGSIDRAPNSAIYPFWGDWVVDSQAAIATKVSGVAPNRQWIVEWRNVAWHGNDAARVSFEAIFTENGGVTFAYDGIDPANPIERGAEGTVGIENAGGTVAFQHLHGADLLTDGTGVHFRSQAPASNSVVGTVACTEVPVEGATVTIAGKSATTGADGSYRIDAIPTKTWPVVATIPDGVCGGSTARTVLVGRSVPVVDFTATAVPTGAGYRLAERTVPYVPLGGGPGVLNGHDVWTSIDLPFPVELYGVAATAARVGSEGSIELAGGHLFPFRGDWVADDQSQVLAGSRGDTPNRQFVVEWRDVRHHDDATTRFTFQAILDEAGGISYAYPSADATFARSGGMALIGLQSRDGTNALLYADGMTALRPGSGLRFDAFVP